LRALGGAMARVPIDATAFAHRDAPILAVAVNFYEGEHDHEQRIGWTRDTVAALDQGVPGAYVGFVREEDDELLRQIYPDETWERLRDVKTRYDPDNVFRRNHNVPPRTTG
jgi:FAD/FMN-containing dehydrogenase